MLQPRSAALAGLLTLILLASLVAATALGAAVIPLGDTLRYLWKAISGGVISQEELTSYTVVADLRAPRVVLAALVGAGLSLLGIAGQAMVRNPLADPFILGVSSGASVGAAAVVALGIFGALGIYALSFAAFLGALAASALVYVLAGGRHGMAPNRLILTGVVLSFGFQALTSTIVFFEPRGDAARAVMFWLLGSLGGANWAQLPVVVAAVVLVFLVLLRAAPALDVLSSGDSAATSMGVDPGRMRRLLFLLTALGTGALVAVSGTVGFIGLVVPHVMRLLLGPAHRRLILLAPLVGAILLVWVDVLSRIATPPRELPLGVMTALVGVPTFLALMARRNYVFGGQK